TSRCGTRAGRPARLSLSSSAGTGTPRPAPATTSSAPSPSPPESTTCGSSTRPTAPNCRPRSTTPPSSTPPAATARAPAAAHPGRRAPVDDFRQMINFDKLTSDDTLTLAASRLGQLFAQITGYLDQALAAGRLGHDHGEDPSITVRAAASFLGDAATSAAALASDLAAAWQQLA